MSPITTDEQADFYRSSHFRWRAAAALACRPRDLVDATDDLLDAGLIPMVGPDMPADIAVWADAARIVAAIAAQRAYPASVAKLAERICAMKLFSPRPAAAAPAPHPFGAELARLLRHRAVDHGAPGLPTVSLTCSHEASALYGLIDYTDLALNYYDFSQALAKGVRPYRRPPTARRVSFPASALIGFADILEESIAAPRATATTDGWTR